MEVIGIWLMLFALIGILWATREHVKQVNKLYGMYAAKASEAGQVAQDNQQMRHEQHEKIMQTLEAEFEKAKFEREFAERQLNL